MQGEFPAPRRRHCPPLRQILSQSGWLTFDFCSSVELKENTVIVVLGASGDLAKKKTFPALFGLVSNVIYRLHASLG